MKVAMVTPSLSRAGGGVSVVVEALSRQLVELGHEVRVFGLAEPVWHAKDRAAWGGAQASTFSITGPKALGYAPGLTQGLIDWHPEVVHSHGLWMLTSRSVLEWHRRTKRGYIVSPHGMLDPWALRRSAWKKRIAGFFYEYEHLSRAHSIHALCAAERDAVRAYGITSTVSIIPNGVVMPSVIEPIPAPWSQQVLPNARVMLYIGRLHPKKNLSSLLVAWAELIRSEAPGICNWRLVISGWDQNNHLSELHRLHSSLALRDSVLFFKPVYGAEKQAAFSNADAFILASLSEGLPMTVLEAWSYGVPTLMTRHCNLPEGFETAAAIEIDSHPHNMVTTLREFILMEDQERHTLTENAVRLLKEQFQWGSVANKFADLYHDCIRKHKQ